MVSHTSRGLGCRGRSLEIRENYGKVGPTKRLPDHVKNMLANRSVEPPDEDLRGICGGTAGEKSLSQLANEYLSTPVS